MRNWAAVFGAVFGMLVIRNRFLFNTPIYELGDSGANSIIIGQAKQFSLLVGNYSRQGFSHPGPAYFYVEAAGEWLFHDLLGIVPTPWNGQVIALYALNAALLATVATIVARWTGSLFPILAVIALVSLEPAIINNAWMPFVYVPSFLLLLVASASVAAGRAEHLWAVALAGGLLVHGHAVFLLFVPVVAGAAIIWLRRRHGFDKKAWAIAAGVLAVFLAPIVVNTLVNWPGEFGKYFGYGNSESAGSQSVTRSLAYVFWYWWPFPTSMLLGLLLIGALLVAVAMVKHPFVRAGLWLSAGVTLLLTFYAYAGIDNLDDPYMGYFYWAVPLFAGIGLAIALAQRLPDRVPKAAPLALACVVIAFVPGFRTNVNDHEQSVPETLAALRAHGNGRPVVLEIAGDYIGPEVAGMLKWAERDGFRACVRDARWSFLTTPSFVCTPDEIARGVVVSRMEIAKDSPVKAGEIARTGTSVFVVTPAT